MTKSVYKKQQEPEYSITSCISLKLYYSLSFLLGRDLTLSFGLFSSLLRSDFGGETSCIASIQNPFVNSLFVTGNRVSLLSLAGSLLRMAGFSTHTIYFSLVTTYNKGKE